MRLLIIDDNAVLSWRLQGHLRKRFEVQAASTGREGQRLAESGKYDVILLDLGLPDVNGEKVCLALRRKGITTPILVLTAEGGIDSKVRLLTIGADDYLTKPFEASELDARIQALIRRRQLGQPAPLLQVEDLTIDPEQRLVSRQGKHIKLRRKEYDILEYLTRNRGKIVTPEMILEHVWNEDAKDTWSNTIRVHIKYLRDKIDKPFDHHLIQTAHGVGYIIGKDRE